MKRNFEKVIAVDLRSKNLGNKLLSYLLLLSLRVDSYGSLSKNMKNLIYFIQFDKVYYNQNKLIKIVKLA